MGNTCVERLLTCQAPGPLLHAPALPMCDTERLTADACSCWIQKQANKQDLQKKEPPKKDAGLSSTPLSQATVATHLLPGAGRPQSPPASQTKACHAHPPIPPPASAASQPPPAAPTALAAGGTSLTPGLPAPSAAARCCLQLRTCAAGRRRLPSASRCCLGPSGRPSAAAGWPAGPGRLSAARWRRPPAATCRQQQQQGRQQATMEKQLWLI